MAELNNEMRRKPINWPMITSLTADSYVSLNDYAIMEVYLLKKYTLKR